MSAENTAAPGTEPKSQLDAETIEKLNQLAVHLASTITCAWCAGSWARYGPWSLLGHLTGWHKVPVEGAAKILAREFEGSSEQAWVSAGENGWGDWESRRGYKVHY
ncbi:MAG: hypothetical protein KGJ23_08595 [Euryarchaeota archaeon]|nr:hypothetical protein [Euryarchaeota archaeon]MDE1836661.1 hypothetical protein [Euryarchaeota archaeon]MDE1880310.1 hypothetical protein [Euryarchaeota archaeon]MDE2044631.1 hypothetical protein [Thermoplasmata archaeon]